MIPPGFIFYLVAIFIWLFYEADWMRVRLPVGKKVIPINLEQWFSELPLRAYGYRLSDKPMPIQSFQSDLKPIKIYREDIAFSPGVTEPLCGWDWLLNREHPQVECRIILEAWGCKHAIVFNPNAHNGNIIKEVAQIALKPTPKERQQIRQQNKNMKEVIKRGLARPIPA